MNVTQGALKAHDHPTTRTLTDDGLHHHQAVLRFDDSEAHRKPREDRLVAHLLVVGGQHLPTRGPRGCQWRRRLRWRRRRLRHGRGLPVVLGRFVSALCEV